MTNYKYYALRLVMFVFVVLIGINVSAYADVWVDQLSENYDIGNFIMTDTAYSAQSKPEVISVNDMDFTKAIRFWGNDTAEYSGSKYTGRLYHENLVNNGRIKKGENVTVSFYARANSALDNPTKISVGVQAETAEHTTGSCAYFSDELTLSDAWTEYNVTLKINNDLSLTDSGYRIVLRLGYYAQTTYIADLRVLSSASTVYNPSKCLEKIRLMQNGSNINTILPGKISLCACLGDGLKGTSLILCLYDRFGCLNSISISPIGDVGEVECSLNVPEDILNYRVTTLIWDTYTQQALYNPITPQLDSTVKSYELNIDNAQTSIGSPCIFTRGGDLPEISIKSYCNNVYDVNIITPDNSKISVYDKLSMENNQRIDFDVNDYVFGEYSSGEYRIDVSGENSIRRSGNDSIYFYISNSESNASSVLTDENNKLVTVPDFKGNRIPDYSAVGYKNGTVPLPQTENTIVLLPSGTDDTEAIQTAVNELSMLPIGENGIRGAVLLKEGIWRVSKTINISASGIVIKGENFVSPELKSAIPYGTADEFEKNNYDGGTVILATSKTPDSLLFSIKGAQNIKQDNQYKSARITNQYVPVGVCSFDVDDTSNFRVGDKVILDQVNNNMWVSDIGMDSIPPRTSQDINPDNPDNKTVQWNNYIWNWKFERVIKEINGNEITVDIPIFNTIDNKYSTVNVYRVEDLRISDIGIENIRAFALWSPNSDGVDDTRHAERFIDVANVKDLWIKNVTAEHFNTYCINLNKSSKCVTISNFYNLIADKSYYNGTGYDSSGRTFAETAIYVGRYGVYVGNQQTLMENVYGINNRHLIEYNARAMGPNVAYMCESKDYLVSMGPHMQWATGGLYDNVKGSIAMQNRLNMGNGHGWSGAWFTAWNTSGELVVQKPPMAQNYSVGHSGTLLEGDFPGYEMGSVANFGSKYCINSLYMYQKTQK